ncbi:MAG: hypothetical protein JO316_08440 [Abitibacteriaceae bacterium]|nr:hypothetical protein [Abditibacteriaceae bacterium]
MEDGAAPLRGCRDWWGIGFGCNSFRTTCGTNFLSNGSDLETCQMLMGHTDSRATKLCDRRALQPTLADIERIRYGRVQARADNGSAAS